MSGIVWNSTPSQAGDALANLAAPYCGRSKMLDSAWRQLVVESRRVAELTLAAVNGDSDYSAIELVGAEQEVRALVFALPTTDDGEHWQVQLDGEPGSTVVLLAPMGADPIGTTAQGGVIVDDPDLGADTEPEPRTAEFDTEHEYPEHCELCDELIRLVGSAWVDDQGRYLVLRGERGRASHYHRPAAPVEYESGVEVIEVHLQWPKGQPDPRPVVGGLIEGLPSEWFEQLNGDDHWITTMVDAPRNPPLDRALAEVDAWGTDRQSIGARESEEGIPDASEWSASDDQAVDLLHKLAAAVTAGGPRPTDTVTAAVASAQELGDDAWEAMIEHLTCDEVAALIPLLEVLSPGLGDQAMGWHCREDSDHDGVAEELDIMFAGRPTADGKPLYGGDYHPGCDLVALVADLG